MYIRVFTFDCLKWGVIFTGLLTISWVCTIVPMAIFQCTPIEKAWDFSMPGVILPFQKFHQSQAKSKKVLKHPTDLYKSQSSLRINRSHQHLQRLRNLDAPNAFRLETVNFNMAKIIVDVYLLPWILCCLCFGLSIHHYL